MSSPALLMIDNVDSFTFILADYLEQLGAAVTVVRNDSLSIEEAISLGKDGIVISPGPGTPADAGISVALAAECIARRHPLLGVCLGHQAIALACGSDVEPTAPMHGKIARVRHDSTGLFEELPSPFAATRYHSLAVHDPRPPLAANAWSEDGTVMAMRHEFAPVHGVQFHPESVASEQGRPILAAFLDMCRRPA